jgi:hypothetical protein
MYEALRADAMPAVVVAAVLRVEAERLDGRDAGPTTTIGTAADPSRGGYSVSTTYSGPSAVVSLSATRSASLPLSRAPSARAPSRIARASGGRASRYMSGPSDPFATAAVPRARASQKHAARRLRRQRTGRVILEARIATDCPSFFAPLDGESLMLVRDRNADK